MDAPVKVRQRNQIAIPKIVKYTLSAFKSRSHGAVNNMSHPGME